MIRHTVQELIENKNAMNVIEYKDELKNVRNYLLDRIKRSENELLQYREDAETLIDEFLDKWIELSQEADSESIELNYFKYKIAAKKDMNKLLLKTFDDIPEHPESISVMSTMRNVDDIAYINIIE